MMDYELRMPVEPRRTPSFTVSTIGADDLTPFEPIVKPHKREGQPVFYRGTGCVKFKDCLTCPFPKCRYEGWQKFVTK